MGFIIQSRIIQIYVRIAPEVLEFGLIKARTNNDKNNF
jgi:hypothetical protein